MKTLGIIAIIAAMNYGLYTWHQNSGPNAPATVATMKQGKVVVYFGAPWCGGCRVAKPQVEELAKDLAGKVRFLMINVDDEPALGQEYGIRTIPALGVLEDGKEKARLHAGSKESMREEILASF
jgi:thiol-disulfide isomerase/thioredoxin